MFTNLRRRGGYEGMKIPLLNLQPEIDRLWSELNSAVEDVLQSGQFILGPQVQAFEEEAAAYLGVKYALGVNSGTDALIIALKAVGVSPGDEVITTPFSFFATAEAISQVGAVPIFVDIDVQSFNLDPDLIEAAITPQTKAILPVHLYGQAAEMELIKEIAAQYGLKVLEDVAQAFGGEYGEKKLGTLGEIGCFSFFPSKNLGAFGDGGLIATNDAQVATMARMLRAHGCKEKYYHEVLGYNSRLDELQAAVLRVKLPYVDQGNEQRRQIAQCYHRLLEGLPGIILPQEYSRTEQGLKHVYHQYTLRVLQGKRDQVKGYLAEQGIETAVYYPVPLHKLAIYKHLNYRLPKAEQAAKEVLSLPFGPYLSTEIMETVVAALKRALD